MKLVLDIAGHARNVSIEPVGTTGGYVVSIDGESLTCEATLLMPGVLSLLIAGQAFRCVLEESPLETGIHVGGERFVYTVADPRSLKARRGRASGATGPVALKAPMPGRIVRVLVESGQTVEVHQGVLVIEAMKMQNESTSPKAGRIVEIRYQPGETVAVGEILAVIE